MASAVARSSPSRPPVQYRRRTHSLAVRLGERQSRKLLELVAGRRSGSPIRSADAASRSRCSARPNGRAAVDAQRLERGPAALERLVVRRRGRARRHRRARDRRTASGEERHAAHRLAERRPEGGQQRASLHERLLDLVARDPSPRRCRRRPRDGCGPRRSRTSGSSARGRGRRSARRRRAPPSRRRDRRARAPRCGRAPRSSGAPVTDPPGKTAVSSSASPTPGAEPPLDGRDEMADPRERALDHQLGPAHGSRARRPARDRFARDRRSSRARPRPSPRPGARRTRRPAGCP